MREETLRTILVSDPHSPGDATACNGALRNFPPFYAAFGVKRGRRDVPAARAAREDLVDWGDELQVGPCRA